MNRRLRIILEAAAAGETGPVHRARAGFLLNELKGKVKRKASKAKPRRELQARARAAQQDRHRLLEEAVHRRAGGVCELCCEPWAPWDNARVLHHLEGGPAKAKLERLSNVMSIHPACHEAYHMNVRAFVPAVMAWCARNNYPLPNRKEYRDAR